MRPLLKLHHDLPLGNRDPRRGVDEVAKQVAGLGRFLTQIIQTGTNKEASGYV